MPDPFLRAVRGLTGAFRALPPNLAASILILASFVVFTAMGVLARIAAESMHVMQIVFLRQVIAAVLLAPVFWRARAEIRAARNTRLHLLRGLTAVGAMTCGLTAVIYIPFADATAIQMAEVLVTTVLAAVVLKETVGWRRWSATAVGFAGVLVMVAPFGGGFDPFALLALVGTLFGGGTAITLRLGAAADSVGTVLFYQGLVVLALLTPPGLWYWSTPTPYGLLVMLTMSVVFVGGQWLFTAALRMGEVSAVAPLHYVRLLMMAVVGFVLYGEVPTLQTVLGSLLVVGSASYTLRRNAVRRVPVLPADCVRRAEGGRDQPPLP